MSAFTKVHMIHEKAYQDWKNHKCNENQVERMDILNKKYMNSIPREDDISQQSSVVSNDVVDDDNAEVGSELNAGGQDLNTSIETPDAENSFVDDTSSMSNNAEVAISNPPNSHNSLNEPRGLNNADAATNSQQEPQSTHSTVDVTPPLATRPAPIAQSHTPGVYNCTPATTSTPSTSVIPGQPNSKLKPYKCTFCPKSYSAPYGLKRHVSAKHSTPSVAQPTVSYNGNYPKLIEINGLPANEVNEDSSQIPLPDDDFSSELQNKKKNSLELEPLRFPSKSKTQKRKKPTENIPPKVMSSRILRKKRSKDDSDDEQTPFKVSRGGNFYSSWD